MQVFKFGGAAITDAASIQKISKIIQQCNTSPLVVVVSAIGKTTQQLEEILYKKRQNKTYQVAIEQCFNLHLKIIAHLLIADKEVVYKKLQQWKSQLLKQLQIWETKNKQVLYSSVVSYGELLSSTIIYYYWKKIGIPCTWVDARDYIKTDTAQQINWQATMKRVITLKKIAQQQGIVLIQGFISSNNQGVTTTLGKEGSDYTAAIIASMLHADALTIWKDVPGVLNADPKKFKNSILLPHLSYQAMMDMAFYGAKVLHPKTIMPLIEKNIPLYIKSFNHPQTTGTKIDHTPCHSVQSIPIYILLPTQCLVTFSFGHTLCNKKRVEKIRHILYKQAVQIQHIVLTSLTYKICIPNEPLIIEWLTSAFDKTYMIIVQQHVSLLTFNKAATAWAMDYVKDKNMLVLQKNKMWSQVVYSY